MNLKAFFPNLSQMVTQGSIHQKVNQVTLMLTYLVKKMRFKLQAKRIYFPILDLLYRIIEN